MVMHHPIRRAPVSFSQRVVTAAISLLVGIGAAVVAAHLWT
jgi:hypothetical protein